MCCRNQVGLADGNWVFQVRGVATSGVSGTTVSASFLVDSSAPVISNLIVSYTAKKQAVNVTVSRSGGTAQVPSAAFRIYTIASDGLLGSGVNPNRSAGCLCHAPSGTPPPPSSLAPCLGLPSLNM